MQTDKQQSAVVAALKLATGWLEQCREAGAYVPLGVIADCEAALANLAPDPVDADLIAQLRKLHDEARGATFDLRPADGPIARLTLFMHENGDKLLATLTTKDNYHD